MVAATPKLELKRLPKANPENKNLIGSVSSDMLETGIVQNQELLTVGREGEKYAVGESVADDQFCDSSYGHSQTAEEKVDADDRIQISDGRVSPAHQSKAANRKRER